MTSQLDIFAAPPAELTWKEVLAGEREQSYFRELLKFIAERRASGITVYPKDADIFNAIKYTAFQDLRVVVIGQDPYHGPNQAHGLSFSVLPPTSPPPSLLNIFKELRADLGHQPPGHGCLEGWAKQGVLLLNAVLTVEAGSPGSHANRGWERFTDRVIREINDRLEGVVFILWGAYAQKKGSFIDRVRHLVIESPHPSPFSADRGFFGSRPFSRANDYLRSKNRPEIDWLIAPLVQERSAA